MKILDIAFKDILRSTRSLFAVGMMLVVPLEYTGATFSAIGHLMPSAWAMDGFQNIIVRGLSIQAVWQPVGILLLYAAAFFGLAVWRFRYD
ncbi:MAG: ABC transporter permease [Chloroflexi bacterium]|nr:ABC transporter permease [Chloroflexota bacterium]